MPRREATQDRSRIQDILFTVLGTSPAVLTETLWALAREKPPFIPHSVYVLTTRTGKHALRQQLFEKGVWNEFMAALPVSRRMLEGRLHFGDASDHIRVVSSADGRGDLEDIHTPEHSAAFADTLMRMLREFTEDPETRIVASLAGGRKTMGALLLACMMLLGREQDRLVHVLVNPPFDDARLQPKFFFPQRGVKHRLPDTQRVYDGASAQIRLCEIPFVRVRGWYEREYRQPPTSYMTLVQRFQKLAPRATNYPVLNVDIEHAQLGVDGCLVRFSGPEFVVLYAILKKHQNGERIEAWTDLSEELSALKAGKYATPAWNWLLEFRGSRFEASDEEDIRKTAGRVRAKLRQAGVSSALANIIVPLIRKPYQPYPSAKIRGLREFVTSADVRVGAEGQRP